jgi:hypothetical protein
VIHEEYIKYAGQGRMSMLDRGESMLNREIASRVCGMERKVCRTGLEYAGHCE